MPQADSYKRIPAVKIAEHLRNIQWAERDQAAQLDGSRKRAAEVAQGVLGYVRTVDDLAGVFPEQFAGRGEFDLLPGAVEQFDP